MNNETIKKNLTEKFGDQLTAWQEPYGMLTFTAPKEINLKVLQFLFDDPELKFQFLTDITALHYPSNVGSELAVVYHLHNLTDNIRLRFKIYTDINKPDVFSASALYQSANWMERETYDFFGVNFIGHPNLKRILNVDEMDYFPLRKEYPLEDQKRTDKDDEMFGRDAQYSNGQELVTPL
jgi:NADH-quinone oxidoreductase subunit C